jgi:Uma2 family endonuclease
MDAPAALPERTVVKLTATDYLLLRGFGAFDKYWKVELLDGVLWGVPADGDYEPESDAVFPVKLTTDHYELLDRAGAFVDFRGTELVDGQVFAMSPQYRPHGFIKDELTYRLRRALEALGSPLHVATEQSVALARFSEPQPDITLTSEPIGAGPIPGNSVALLVEVADTTSKFDRVQKATIYASAEVSEYWIADVNRRVILRMWKPTGSAYAERDTVDFGGQLRSETIAGLAIETSGL